MACSPSLTRWSKDRIVQALCRTVLFGGLSTPYVGAIADCVVPVEYSSGQIVFVMGDRPKGIYITAEGSARTVRHTAEGREQVLSVDYPYSTIAEIPIFDGGVCFSTAVAQGPTHLFFIRKDDVVRLWARCPVLFSRSVEVIASRLRAY